MSEPTEQNPDDTGQPSAVDAVAAPDPSNSPIEDVIRAIDPDDDVFHVPEPAAPASPQNPQTTEPEPPTTP